MAHSKHAEVRARYGYRCGYCGVSETDTGGELAVDHFHPVSAGGGDDDQNLVYACFRCNLNKGDFWSDDADLLEQHRLLHPLRDDLTSHYTRDASGLLTPLTETGRFHIETLRLNRTALIQHRQVKRAAQLEQERTRQQTTYIALLLEAITELEGLVSRLRLAANREESTDDAPISARRSEQ